ncbi:CLPTM1-domain-containing protein [Tilletiaria anomala UBC 951]|uniref:CLPTM1-domain-containing protein n=1 Tax=Tilletiaria anomala (strain ATCC 24038 / CBS 436.72 / UBC 951) TaxID=1037660 RepID=A0A066WHA4_TILAU|nr:CLPTM1-domain-containing protein [Tilletiaria anomala UBC 951]KDN53347.1 CLPTM1-domain-containing protein [Tilletiaria anomala UBC 951]
MPESNGAAAVAPAGGQGANAGPRGGAGGDWKWTILRSLGMYFAVQALLGKDGLVTKYRNKDKFFLSASEVAPLGSQPEGVSLTQPTGQAQPAAKAGVNVVQAWPASMPLDFYVFLTSGPPASSVDISSQYSSLVAHGGGADASPNLIDFNAHAYANSVLNENIRGDVQPVVSPQSGRTLSAVKWTNIKWSDSSLKRKVEVDIDVYPEVRTENHTIWADVFLTKSGVSPDPTSASYRQEYVFHSRKLLSRLYLPKKKTIEKKLFASNERSKEEQETEEAALAETEQIQKHLVTWWHPNLTLALVPQQQDTLLPLKNLAAPLGQWIHPIPDFPANSPNLIYTYPALFPNDFWHLREHMYQFNASTKSVPLSIELYATSWLKFQMLAAFSDSFEKQGASGMAGSEIDMIKTTLLETNPWFLALTVIVSIFHSLFEFLAFSSEVSHWRNKKNLAGVSVGSILTNVVVQLIILLYLLDSREDTSWTILMGQGVGMAVEAWKLTKAITVSIIRTPEDEKTLWRYSPVKLDIKDKHVLSEEEKATQVYDKLAFKYVGIAMTPILIGWTIYSALYQTHKGYWSFFIGTLTSFVYAFSFSSMIPQLIVNHKLRSTAGMNTKTFVFKFLTTIVDDLFAFCIKMPTLHRLACFRDDAVFVIFLYQRWKFGVDPTRVNEFGQVLDPKAKATATNEKAGEGETAAVTLAESKKTK